MNAIRIRKKLDSETLDLPELRPLVGQTVEIIVLTEESVPGIRPGSGDWTAFDRLAREVADYDFDAQREQDQVDLQHADDPAAMILVDANIIGYLKKPDPKVLGLFQSYQAAICGITRAEVLHGARNPADRQRLLNQLNILAHVTIPHSIWDAVGDALAALRAGGVTVPFADVVVACVAIEYGMELWTRDQHFSLMQAVLPQLMLFQEPP